MGEATTLHLAQKLRDGKPLSEIQGIYYKEHGKLLKTAVRPITQSEALQAIDFDLVDWARYGTYNLELWQKERVFIRKPTKSKKELSRFFSIQTSRGCPYKCVFCTIPLIYGSEGDYRKMTYLKRSAESVLDEIEDLIKKYSVRQIMFQDECFLNSRRWLEDFLAGIEARKLKFVWNINARSDIFAKGIVSEGLLKRMKKEGCISMFIGAESGSNRLLKKVQKYITVEETIQTARILNRYNIPCIYGLMMAIPGETRADLVSTLDLILKLYKIGGRHVRISGPVIFLLFPRCKLWGECKRHGYEEPLNLQEWADLPMEEIVRPDFRKLPWVSKKNYALMDYLKLMGARHLPTNKFLLAFLELICRFRKKINWFRFPVELLAWNYYEYRRLKLRMG